MYAESHHRTGVHNADDVDDAIRALTEAELSRLTTAARVWFRAFRLDAVAADPDDLVSEAVFRTTSGRRGWKVGVDFHHHLRSVMRSIVDSWRKSAERRAAAGVVRESDLPEAEEDPSIEEAEEPGPLEEAPSEAPGVHRTVAGRDEFRAIEAHFAGDQAAGAVLSGKFEELKGPEIQEEYDLTKKQYLAAVRRIRRYVDRQGGAHGH